MLNRLIKVLLPLVLAFSATVAHADHRGGYYMTVFGIQGTPNKARYAHTFATLVHTDESGVKEELTISWLPAPGHFRRDQGVPVLGIHPGHNYTLDETMAIYRGDAVRYWGPYEVSFDLWERAVARWYYLANHQTSYKMMIPIRDNLRMPPLHNQPGGAINCIMAVSDLGGWLDTGDAWGFEASGQVLQFLSPFLLHGYAPEPHVAEAMRLNQRLR